MNKMMAEIARWRTFGVTALIACWATHAVATTAPARDWFVYTQADASARGDGYSSQDDTRCSGTRASKSYCGGNANIFSNQKTLISKASATVIPVTQPFYGVQHGDGYAYADLRKGELKISDHAYSDNYGSELTNGGAVAQFGDTLHFHGLDQGSFSIGVKLHIDGLFKGNQQPRFAANIQSSAGLLAGEAAWSDSSSDGAPSCVGIPVGYAIQCEQPANFGSFNVRDGWTQFGPADFTGTLLVDGAHPDVTVALYLSAGGSTEGGVQSTYAEFNHTAGISFDLPAGVTYTSDSGVFLTGRTTSVPEPTSWTMLAGGIGLLGLAARRARSVVTA